MNLRAVPLAAALLLGGLMSSIAAQTASTASADNGITVQFDERTSWRRDVVRIGSSFTLGADDAARNVTVMLADATIAGRVPGDVVVVLGQAHVAATALIEGNLVVTGGGASVAEGARIRGDFVVVGGPVDAAPGFAPGGDHIVIGPEVLGARFSSLTDWLTRGLLLGRPIVPSLGWVWAVVVALLFVYLLTDVLFDQPVAAVAQTLGSRPLTSIVVGFLVMLLVGPVCVLLGVSIVGILVIPLVVGALIAGGLVGKVAAMRWMGGSLLGPAETPARGDWPRFALGFLLVTIAYMIPVLGITAWTLLGVFGLGGAALAFLSAYRRERPAPVARGPLPTAFVPPVAVAGVPGTVPLAGQVPLDAPVEGTRREGDVADSLVSPPVGRSTPDLLFLPRALFLERLAAGVLDLILVFIAWQLFDRILRGERGFFLLLLAYFVGFWTWKGTTVGGIICQLRVVRVDGQPLRFVDALVRALSGIFSLVVAGVGFLWILRDVDRQAWHDRIAGTYVVKVPRNWPL